MDAFISHKSENRAIADQLETALGAAGLDVWLDDSDITIGALLRKELQTSIERCRTLVLLWSVPAAQSRWINAEWLTAFHLGKYLIPCTLDREPLPQCLQPIIALNIETVSNEIVERLARAIRRAPASANALPPIMRAEASDLARAIAAIDDAQQVVTTHLGERNVAEAAAAQAGAGAELERAMDAWPLDPVIVNLHGYHLKNAYLVKYWDAIQAGRGPADDLLAQAERRFFEALSLDPNDPSALNGLGSVLLLERELEAAEFFIRAAIRAAQAQGMATYPAAEQDLQVVLYYKGAGS